MPEVTVAKPIARRLTDWDEFTGRLIARDKVEIRARVTGILQKRNYTEGATVRAGQSLFTLDPAPYQTAAAKAEADLASAEARLAQAEPDRGADAEHRTRPDPIAERDTGRGAAR